MKVDQPQKKHGPKELTSDELKRLTSESEYEDWGSGSVFQAFGFEIIEWSFYAFLLYLFLAFTKFIWWPPISAIWTTVSKLF